MARFSLRTLFIMVTLIALAAGGVVSLIQLGMRLDPFNQETFVPAQWLARHREARARMARDLVRHHLPGGLPRTKVEALLGRPDEVLSGRVDAGGNRLLGASTYSYYLGSVGYDTAFLYVHVDRNGNIVSAEITGY
jgi:hypothetical protein